jgi:hypothetical protein
MVSRGRSSSVSKCISIISLLVGTAVEVHPASSDCAVRRELVKHPLREENTVYRHDSTTVTKLIVGDLGCNSRALWWSASLVDGQSVRWQTCIHAEIRIAYR